MPSLSFLEADTTFKWKSRALLSKWIKLGISTKGYVLGEINAILCSDIFLLDLNERHLNHHTLTDIITFDYSEANTLSGELYISADRVSENAHSFQTDIQDEICRVLCHGILHLMGQKDKSPRDRARMTEQENWFLSLRVPRETNPIVYLKVPRET